VIARCKLIFINETIKTFLRFGLARTDLSYQNTFQKFLFPANFSHSKYSFIGEKKFQQIFYNLRITSTDSLLHQAITPPLEISPSKVLRPGHLRPKTLVLDDIRFYFGQKAI